MENNFGERLAHAMELRGMRQKELAKATGVTEATVSRYVNEKRRPDIDFIRDVVKVLRVSADYLLGFTDDICVAYDRQKTSLNLEEGASAKYSIISRGTDDMIAIVDEKQVEVLDSFIEMVKNTMRK